MGGFAAQTKPVDADIVREVGRDFDFGVARRRPRADRRRSGAEPGDRAAARSRPAASRDRPTSPAPMRPGALGRADGAGGRAATRRRARSGSCSFEAAMPVASVRRRVRSGARLAARRGSEGRLHVDARTLMPPHRLPLSRLPIAASALAQTRRRRQAAPRDRRRAPAAAAAGDAADAGPRPPGSRRRHRTGLPIPTDYVIGPDDVLGIVFWRDADMTRRRHGPSRRHDHAAAAAATSRPPACGPTSCASRSRRRPPSSSRTRTSPSWCGRSTAATSSSPARWPGPGRTRCRAR